MNWSSNEPKTTLYRSLRSQIPQKIPPKSTLSRAVNVPSRKKRKIQSQLAEAENNPHAPPSQIASLQRKLALAHIRIRDAINNDLLYREQQAVSKIKDNPKYFPKKFSRKRSNISMLFDKNGAIKSNPTDIANLLQQQFLSVFSDLSKTKIDAASFPPPAIHNPFTDDMLEFSTGDIIKAIEEIKPNAASGPDEIPVILLKNCKEFLAKPIYIVWSQSLETVVVPSFYKTSHVSLFIKNIVKLYLQTTDLSL